MTLTQLAQKHNLEPESAKALNYDPSDPDKMKLPVGSKCGDCVHIRRCSMIYGHVETDTYCDWSPSRFIARPTDLGD